MRSLIITAHPSTQGFTHAIAERYKVTKEGSDNTAEILNLYTTNLKL